MTTTDARPDRQATGTHPATRSGHGPRIAITVHGTPVPQGSKTPCRGPGGRPTLRDANKKTLHPWRAHITTHATDQTRYHDTPLTGPVKVWMVFTFDRPKTHYRTGRFGHLLRDDAPPYPTAKNDLDKLVRALWDAITDAGVWKDDSQVVDIGRSRKVWAGEHEHALDQPGVTLVIEELT